MITVSKEFQWAMAHMLDGHEGLCKNLHGHEYKLIVTVNRRHEQVLEAPGHPGDGMVVDFKMLKNIVKKKIVDPLDHALMLNQYSTDAFELSLLNLCQIHDKKYQLVNFRPTAEHMVHYFARILKDELAAVNLELTTLRLYETPTSYADWIPATKITKEEV